MSYSFAPESDVVLFGNGPFVWDLTGITLSFGPTSRLIFKKPVTVTGGTLTATDPSRGWGGIRFEPGSVGTLSGVTVSDVRTVRIDDPALPARSALYPPGAAVRADNATVTITGGSRLIGGTSNIGAPVPGGTVRGTNGVLATGGAVVTVTGLSEISGHGSLGFVATGGSQVTVDERSRVLQNALGGVLASGYQSRATVSGYAAADGNDGPGGQADGQAHVEVRSPAGASNTSVSGNIGGLAASAGGSVDASQCTTDGPTGRPNTLSFNLRDGGLDATATGGSHVFARRAYWDGRTTLATQADGSSPVSVDPVAPTLATTDARCPVVGQPRAAGEGLARADLSQSGTADAAGRGVVTVAVAERAAAAREAAWLGDADGAFALLSDAAAAALTDDDREAVFEATAALLADARPPGVVAGLEADAAGAGTTAPWARRALAVAYAVSGRAGEADALAVALTADPVTAHAMAGHGLRVRLAVDARDEAGALTRLSEMAGPASDPSGAEALGSSLALVAAAFPGADLSGVTGVAARGGRRGMSQATEAATPGTAARGGTAADLSRGGTALSDGLDVSPNPVAGRAAVRVALSVPAARAVVTVYDALGRRVAVLHDGPLDAGAHGFGFDGSSLPPGVYVVHVRADGERGAPWTDVRRVTVVR